MKRWEWGDLQFKVYKIKQLIKDSKKEKYRKTIIWIINKKFRKIKILSNL